MEVPALSQLKTGDEDIPWEQLDPAPQGHGLVIIPGKALTESTSWFS